MKRWLLTFVLSVCACAQTNGFRPDFVQSHLLENLPGSGQIAYFNDVVSGNLLVGCASWAQTGLTLGVSDNLGTSYSLTSALVPGSGITVEMWYGAAPSSGADTMTITGLTGFATNVSIAEFSNISATLDTSATASTSASAGSLTVTPTTTVNGDLVASCVSGNSGGNTTNFYGSFPQQIISGTSGNCCALMTEFANLGLAGSQSITITNNAFRYQPTHWGIIALAFQPTAISIATSALPDGAQTSAYKATLQAVGGAGAYTWSALSGMPSWASLSSGGVITGTPNANASSAINFQVSDGTHTATRSLSLRTGTSFNTPSLVQFKVGTGGQTVTTTSSVSKNNVLVVVGSSANGLFIMPTSGSSHFLSDSLGTVFTRIYPITNATDTSWIAWIGIAPACGVDTIHYTSPSGNGFNFEVQEWTGTQPVLDDGANAVQVGAATSPISLTTGSYTAQVANETLLETAIDNNQADTLTLTSPFTTLSNGLIGSWLGAVGYDAVTTATTYTSNATVTTASPTVTRFSLQLVGLRPGIAGPVACHALPIRHRAQVY